MTIELGISLTAMLLGLSGLVFGLTCLARYRNCSILFEIQGRQLEDAENALSEYKQLFESAAQKTADNTRRIAWLETRVRQPKKAESDIAPEISDVISPNSAPVPNITERRHRVLSLSSRGQNAESISATLGMLKGEVELILSLNQMQNA